MKTWQPNQSGTFSNRVNIHNKNDEKIFVIEHYLDDVSENKKITNLITSAPELLESLQLLLIDMDERGRNMQGDAVKIAKEAINKALGL